VDDRGELLAPWGRNSRSPTGRTWKREWTRRSSLGFLSLSRKNTRSVPLKVENGVLTAAAADPLNQEALDDLRLILSVQEVRTVLSSEGEVLRAINRFYEQGSDTPEEMIQSLDMEPGDRLIHELEETEDLLEASGEAPVIRLVNLILFQGVKERASDIHIEPFQKELKVRYRIDGSCTSD